jgi:hypothetical protein
MRRFAKSTNPVAQKRKTTSSCRRTGVGKTAILEGLAHALSKPHSASLKDKDIYGWTWGFGGGAKYAANLKAPQSRLK